jgi:hypothetical protein
LAFGDVYSSLGRYLIINTQGYSQVRRSAITLNSDKDSKSCNESDSGSISMASGVGTRTMH